MASESRLIYERDVGEEFFRRDDGFVECYDYRGDEFVIFFFFSLGLKACVQCMIFRGIIMLTAEIEGIQCFIGVEKFGSSNYAEWQHPLC